MTDSVSPFDKQIANRNYMSPLGFKLVLTKTPKVSKKLISQIDK